MSAAEGPTSEEPLSILDSGLSSRIEYRVSRRTAQTENFDNFPAKALFSLEIEAFDLV
jgi:hypothetical protein